MSVDNLIRYIGSGVPVLVLLQAREDYHRVVAIWYDDERIIFEDPYTFHRVFLSFSDLEKRRYAKEHWKKVIRHGIAVQGKTITYDENYLQPMM